MRILFDKIDEFMRVYNGSKYLVLIGLEKYNSIYNRTRYFWCIKSGITDVISHYHAKIKVDSDNSLSIKKRLILLYAMIHINSVLNKDKIHPYYKIKCSYQLAKK